jgi:hypothetical protein
MFIRKINIKHILIGIAIAKDSISIIRRCFLKIPGLANPSPNSDNIASDKFVKRIYWGLTFQALLIYI